MYEVTIILTENKKKERLCVEKTISGEDRKELLSSLEDIIKEMAKSKPFVSPNAEYFITKNGMYLDGEIDLKVKINRNGVSVKLGELTI